MDEVKKLKEIAGLVEVKPEDEAKHQWMINNNIEKITKTLKGVAYAMDKADRPDVDKASKQHVSLYINSILTDIIDNLQRDGFEIHFKEEGR